MEVVGFEAEDEATVCGLASRKRTASSAHSGIKVTKRHEHGHVDARGRAGDRRAVDHPEEEDEYVSTCPPISS